MLVNGKMHEMSYTPTDADAFTRSNVEVDIP